MAENDVKSQKKIAEGVLNPIRLTDGIIVKDVNVENKSIEELEKEKKEQKAAQDLLIRKINEQGYKAPGDWEKFLGFKKNINSIYLKIKELKRVGN